MGDHVKVHGANNEQLEPTTTLNKVYSVWLWLMLLSPHPARHWFSILWQLMLEDTMLEDMMEFSFYRCYLYSHILTNNEFKHVTSTYYHSWYLVFEFTFDDAYFHRVIDIWCMPSYSVYQTQNILLCNYKWIGCVWGVSGCSSRLHGNYQTL